MGHRFPRLVVWGDGTVTRWRRGEHCPVRDPRRSSGVRHTPAAPNCDPSHRGTSGFCTRVARDSTPRRRDGRGDPSTGPRRHRTSGRGRGRLAKQDDISRSVINAATTVHPSGGPHLGQQGGPRRGSAAPIDGRGRPQPGPHHRRTVGQATAGQGHSLYSGGLGSTVRPKVDALTPARQAYQATAAVTRPR